MIVLKSKHEIQRLQESADLVSEVLNKMIDMAEPGVSTIELDELAEKTIRDYGAKPAFKGYRGFPFTVCCSINEQVVHGFPSKRKLQEGDLVSLDVGVIHNGFVGDCARSFGVGTLSPEVDQLLRRAYYALRSACKEAIAGKRVGDLSNITERFGHQFGYGIVRDFVGHGVGHQLHEDPQIPNFGKPGTGARLKEGLVICIEPMYNLGTYEVKVLDDGWTVVTKDGTISAHVEDMVAITKNGPEILTSAKGVIFPEEEGLPVLP